VINGRLSISMEPTGRFGLLLVIKDCCITGPRYVDSFVWKS
jgi:hypothetical protein